MKEYKVAIYLRLSKEDKEKNNSIDMQRQITKKYAKDHNFNIINEYIDNGYSGVLDSRPALNKLMEDINNKKINLVIVKDISRLTRDKNLTSYYTDIFFPENKVRLISVTEDIDTGEKYEIDDIVALKGIINQSYIEDISKKIKAVKKNYKEQGKFIEASIAYGYKKDKKDKHKIVIDNNAAQIVKEIFNLYINGVSQTKIAEKLNEKKILTPSQYQNLKLTSKYWTKNIVNRILNNPIYTGKIILNKYENNLKLKKRIVTPKKEFIFKENTHEAIISEKDYEKVQNLKGNKTKKAYIYLLKGLVFCKKCKKNMTYKNSKPIRIDSNGNITGNKNNLGYFICRKCNNKIMENGLNKIVLNRISKKINKYLKIIEINENKKIQSEIIKQESKLKILYLKKIEGLITQEIFVEQYKKYKENMKKLKSKINRKETINYEKFDNIAIKKLVEKIEIKDNNEIEIILKV